MSQKPTARSLQLSAVGSRLSAHGFTLVEMAVVLSIIGLIIGGIIMGSGLQRNQAVQQVLADAKLYRTAIQQFRTQYGFLPGDFPTATSVWGDDATNCADGAITNGAPGTCNGDGDSVLEAGAGASVTGEAFQAWKQLMLAQYIVGSYSGLAGSSNNYTATPGSNIPTSVMKGAGFFLWSWGTLSGNASFFDADYDNAMLFGATVSASYPYAPALTPKEAGDIDSKADDGYPGFGDIVSFKNTFQTNCATSDVSGTAAYSLSYQTEGCALLFLSTFAEAS